MKIIQVGIFMCSIALCVSQTAAQWVQSNGPYGGRVQCLAVSGMNLFAGTYGGVFLSTNNGTSWTEVNTGMPYTIVYALAVSGTNLFAATCGDGVLLSTDNGKNWTEASNGLTNTYVTSLAVNVATQKCVLIR